MVSTDAEFDVVHVTLENVQASIESLEHQAGQLPNLSSEPLQGNLPSNTEANMRKQLKAITLRNGRKVKVWAKSRPNVDNSKYVAGDTTLEDDVVIEDSNNKGKGI